MYTSFFHRTPLVPLTTKANPRVAPTMLCVPETGILNRVARINQMHEPAKYQGHYDKGEQGVDGTSDAMQMVR